MHGPGKLTGLLAQDLEQLGHEFLGAVFLGNRLDILQTGARQVANLDQGHHPLKNVDEDLAAHVQQTAAIAHSSPRWQGGPETTTSTGRSTSLRSHLVKSPAEGPRCKELPSAKRTFCSRCGAYRGRKRCSKRGQPPDT